MERRRGGHAQLLSASLLPVETLTVGYSSNCINDVVEKRDE